MVVVGGGQAGLSLSYCLAQRDVEHVVLERDRVAHEWRDRRWDSFCLVTPNWQCQLPGFPYPGDDPDGFMPRERCGSGRTDRWAELAEQLNAALTVPDPGCRQAGYALAARYTWPTAARRHLVFYQAFSHLLSTARLPFVRW